MSEWFDNQKKINGDFQKLLQERIGKANPHRNLTVEETRRLAKLEAIADKLKRGENVQNRQLQTWLCEDHFLLYVNLFKCKILSNKGIKESEYALEKSFGANFEEKWKD